MEQKDFAGALSAVSASIEADPTSVEAFELRSVIRSITGDFKGAIADLGKAIELKPDAAKYYFKRGVYRSLSPDAAGALKDLDTAIEKGEQSDSVFTTRARIKRTMGDLDGALADYKLAVSIRPHSAAANNGYALVLERKGKTEEAMDYLEKFISKIEADWNYDFPKPKVKLISGNRQTSKTTSNENGKTAVVGVQTALSGNSTGYRAKGDREAAETDQLMNLAAAYSNLARMYEKAGDKTKALYNVEMSLALSPGGIGTYDIRGRIRLSQKDYDGAISDFTASINSLSVDGGSRLNRGIAYFLKGNEKEAQNDFNDYLRMYPGGKGILEKRIEEARKQRETK